MLPMKYQTWNPSLITQYNNQSKQALLSDEQRLVSFSTDFGNLLRSSPLAVCIPTDKDQISHLIQYAGQHQLPITIRAKGLSQGGQTLPVAGGLTLSMEYFTAVSTPESDGIWVEPNATWAEVLHATLKDFLAPPVLPYNCNLSVGGLISIGGVGASSFKQGTVNAHITALEIIDGLGQGHTVDKESPLFHACLSGQGQFGVITKARIKLRPVQQQVRTFYLVYTDQQQWLEDAKKAQKTADYMELFCSPSIQGMPLIQGQRRPLTQWLYTLHLSLEFQNQAPTLEKNFPDLNPWQILHTQDESISSYFLRHDTRFEAMKRVGQWELLHPWYECFIPMDLLTTKLKDLLQSLPPHFANLVHVVPIENKTAKLLQLPETNSFCSFMILNPGIPYPLKDSCIETIAMLDALFLPLSGKRYPSGFLGQQVDNNYWKTHFGQHLKEWQALKQQCDPKGVFSSLLHPPVSKDFR